MIQFWVRKYVLIGIDIDIDSDSYVMAVSKKDDYEKLSKIAENIGQRIELAHDM